MRMKRQTYALVAYRAQPFSTYKQNFNNLEAATRARHSLQNEGYEVRIKKGALSKFPKRRKSKMQKRLAA